MMRDRWGDPQIEEDYSETDLYIRTQIVMNGELTEYGEELYEKSKDYVYDEKTEEWILI